MASPSSSRTEAERPLPDRVAPADAAPADRQTLWRVVLAALAARLLCWIVFVVQASGTDVTGYRDFVQVAPGQERSSRVRELQQSALLKLAPFDGQLYLDIARRGYRRFEEPPFSNHAFFPLYPMVLAVLERLPANTELLASLLSVALCALGAAGLHRHCERVGISSWVPLALFLAWPASPFQSLVYGESLFFCMSVWLPLLAAEGRWVPATAVGALLGLCRPQGILATALCLPMRHDGARFRSWRPGLLPTCV